MNNNYTQITFNAKVQPIEVLNPEFTLTKVYVQGVGKNRNFSYMSKENIEKYSKESLGYCPVVGHIIKVTDPETGKTHSYMGGHDYTINENWEIVSLTVPYGVVVNDSFGFETINEYGTDVEYLTANAILWTGRYPELNECIYSDDFYFNQSMEIAPTQYRPLESDSNYMDIVEWTYSALCLLGKADDKNSPEHTEPCFISSSVLPVEFSKNNFVSEFEELKTQLAFCLECNDAKGGTELDEKMMILEKFNKTVEELDFSIEEMTAEELSQKMTELFSEPTEEPVVNEPVAEEPVEPTESTPVEPTPDFTADQDNDPVEPSVEPTEPVVTSFSATYREKRDALDKALPCKVEYDEKGYIVDETYFWMRDFDDEFVYVEKSHWNANGYDCEDGRMPYTFDEASVTATITGEFEKMYHVWLTAEEKAKVESDRTNFEQIQADFANLQTEFDTYKENYSTENTVVEELNKFKSTVEANGVFEKFESTIGSTKEFAELKENFMNYSVTELEKECIYIRGLYASTVGEPAENKEGLKFSVIPENTEDDNEPYGGIFKKYLNK